MGSPTATFSGWPAKLPCPSLDHSQACHYALRDIEQNAEDYIADFLAP